MDVGQQPIEPDQTTLDVRPVAEPPQNPLFFGPDGVRPFWCLLIYALILTLPIAILVGLDHIQPAGTSTATEKQIELTPFTSTIAEWLQLAIVFFATWIMSRIEDRDVTYYGLARSNRRIHWLITGAFWGLLWLSVLIGILVLTGHLVVTGVLLALPQGLRYGVEWGVMFIGVAVFEEFFFRGYLQFTLARCLAGAVKWIAPTNRYARPIGFWAAAILISFGFGFSHGYNAGESPIGLLCAGLAGLMFTFSLWRTGSLWWAIGTHTAWDWAQSYLYGVADSGGITRGHLLATHPAGSPLMSGGLTGPEGSIFVLPVMVCMTLVIVFTLPKRPTPFDADPRLAPQDDLLSPAVNSAHG